MVDVGEVLDVRRSAGRDEGDAADPTRVASLRAAHRAGRTRGAGCGRATDPVGSSRL
jgi:hypothetical protein